MNKVLVLIVLVSNLYSIKCIDYQNDLILKGINRIHNIEEELKSAPLIRPFLRDYEFFKDGISQVLYDSFMNPLDYPLPNISENCLQQATEFVTALATREQWTLTVIDSIGKPGSGILEGNLKWRGLFRQCLDVVAVNTTSDWKGQYCSLVLQDLKLNPFIPMIPTIGLCLPNECNSNEVVEILNYGINSLLVNVSLPFNLTNITDTQLNCYEPAKIDAGAIIALIIISILLVCSVSGTVYDVYKQKIIVQDKSVEKKDEEKELIEKKKHEEPLILQIILCFSLYTNLKKLFTVRKGGDQLDCLHAIRFLSMGWVVLGHTFAFYLGFATNGIALYGWIHRFSIQIVTNAFFSVDSFFMISGLLNSYLFLKSIEKSGYKLSPNLFVKYYIHRIWRITPPYMLTVMVTACLTKYWGTGPEWPTADGLDGNCRTYWWANLFYINNIVEVDHMCFGIAWYLANDMQFYFIAPIMLIPLAMGFSKKIYSYVGYGISGAILILNMLITAIVMLSHPGSETGTLGIESLWFQKNVYYTPWCRIGPFIIGILTGYIIYKCKSNPNFKLNNALNIIGWYLCLFSLSLMLWGYWPNVASQNPNNHLNKAENILYQISCRIIWAIGLGWIIFSCVMKKGGFMNDILCWTIWTPLSRLSFSAYLIHLNILLWYIYQQEKTLQLSEINLAYIYLGNMVFSYLAALVVNQLFEVPLLGLEKFVFGKKK